MEKDVAIKVTHVSKDFKLYYDKANTLKEKILFFSKKNRSRNNVLHVLKDINIEIKKGESVALIGTNGSGKSTLLKLMNRIIYPTKGKITKDGKLTSLLELGAGFHDDFTGRENIYFNASIFGLTREEIDKRLNDIIEFSELGEFIDNPVRTYSSGVNGLDFPFILGHENIGIIEEIGEEVKGYSVGERVIVNPVICFVENQGRG